MARMLGAVIRRYHMSQQVIEYLTRPSAALRLCQFISDELPEDVSGDSEVAIRLPSHEQMASRLVCTRETISRSFHQLIEAGVLYSTGRGKYRVRPQSLLSFMTG
jgi:DNA-binding transcriptional regulator YhcF (GntR family)